MYNIRNRCDYADSGNTHTNVMETLKQTVIEYLNIQGRFNDRDKLPTVARQLFGFIAYHYLYKGAREIAVFIGKHERNVSHAINITWNDINYNASISCPQDDDIINIRQAVTQILNNYEKRTN